MILINQKGHTISVDNNDPETVSMTDTEAKEIRDLTGKQLRELSTETLRSNLRFINVG
jgi:hypothetical protein